MRRAADVIPDLAGAVRGSGLESGLHSLSMNQPIRVPDGIRIQGGGRGFAQQGVPRAGRSSEMRRASCEAKREGQGMSARGVPAAGVTRLPGHFSRRFSGVALEAWGGDTVFQG